MCTARHTDLGGCTGRPRWWWPACFLRPCRGLLLVLLPFHLVRHATPCEALTVRTHTRNGGANGHSLAFCICVNSAGGSVVAFALEAPHRSELALDYRCQAPVALLLRRRPHQHWPPPQPPPAAPQALPVALPLSQPPQRPPPPPPAPVSARSVALLTPRPFPSTPAPRPPHYLVAP